MVGIVVAAEVARRKQAALPATLFVSDLRDSAHLVTLLGEPDLRYIASRAKILREGFDGFEVRPDRLPGASDQNMEVIVWRRSELFWALKSFLVVVDPLTRRTLCFNSYAIGGAAPVIVLGNNNEVPGLSGHCS